MLTLEQIESAARKKSEQIPDSSDATRVNDLAALVADLAAHMRGKQDQNMLFGLTHTADISR